MRNFVVIVIFVVAAGGLLFYLGRESNRVPPLSPPEESLLREGEVIGRVIVNNLAQKTELKVSELSGSVKTTIKNEGSIFDLSFVDTVMRADTPFTVNYFVDLSKIGLNDYHYNERTRTLTVEAPQPYPAVPNLDESRRKVEIDGMWVSRKVSAGLAQTTSKQGQKIVAQSAADPRNLGRSRDIARGQLAAVVALPLRKALNHELKVIVRFAGDPDTESEQMDVGPTICEVLKLQPDRCSGQVSSR